MPDVGNQTREMLDFPESLFAWGNSGAYAVSRSSDVGSGWQKPPLRTRLIMQLEALADGILDGSVSAQASIFLVGGPGNGKTHAAKYGVMRKARRCLAFLYSVGEDAVEVMTWYDSSAAA